MELEISALNNICKKKTSRKTNGLRRVNEKRKALFSAKDDGEKLCRKFQN